MTNGALASKTNANAALEEGSLHGPTARASVPRIIRRNMGFNQSRNSVYIHQKNAALKIWTLVQHDWFHAFLRVATWKSLLFLLSFWTAMILVFAGFYMAVDRQRPDINCGLGVTGFPIGFGPAFAFSLETCTTGTCFQPYTFLLSSSSVLILGFHSWIRSSQFD